MMVSTIGRGTLLLEYIDKLEWKLWECEIVHNILIIGFVVFFLLVVFLFESSKRKHKKEVERLQHRVFVAEKNIDFMESKEGECVEEMTAHFADNLAELVMQRDFLQQLNKGLQKVLQKKNAKIVELNKQLARITVLNQKLKSEKYELNNRIKKMRGNGDK